MTFAKFDKSVLSEKGHVLSKKTRELITIGVPLQHSARIALKHIHAPDRKAGATEAESSEAVMLAAPGARCPTAGWR